MICDVLSIKKALARERTGRELELELQLESWALGRGIVPAKSGCCKAVCCEFFVRMRAASENAVAVFADLHIVNYGLEARASNSEDCIGVFAFAREVDR